MDQAVPGVIPLEVVRVAASGGPGEKGDDDVPNFGILVVVNAATDVLRKNHPGIKCGSRCRLPCERNRRGLAWAALWQWPFTRGVRSGLRHRRAGRRGNKLTAVAAGCSQVATVGPSVGGSPRPNGKNVLFLW